MKNLYKFLSLFICLFAGEVMGQDIHFSQFYETPLYRNPALAGIVSGDVRVQAVYRTQWNSIAHAYKTASLSGEYKLPVGNSDDFLTMGLQLFSDKAGTAALTTTQVLPVLNYHKSLSAERNTYLSLGFMGGFVQRRIDRSKITTNSQYDGGGDGESFTESQYTYLDGSVGASLNAGFGESESNNFFIGLAYHHFNRPKNSFYAGNDVTISPKYVLSGGIKFGVAEDSYLTIESDYFQQGSFREIIGGAMYGVKIGPDLDRPDYTLHGGAFIRLNDAVIPTVKLDYSPFSVGLSYDVNISPLKTSSYGRGGFELSVTYIGFLDRENSSLNAVRCPRY